MMVLYTWQLNIVYGHGTFRSGVMALPNYYLVSEFRNEAISIIRFVTCLS